MKIAYVYDALVSCWVKGGTLKRVYEISRRFVERGHDVHWFGMKWWDGEGDIVKDGIYPQVFVNRRGYTLRRECR